MYWILYAGFFVFIYWQICAQWNGWGQIIVTVTDPLTDFLTDVSLASVGVPSDYAQPSWILYTKFYFFTCRERKRVHVNWGWSNMTSTWGRSQERNSFGTFKSLERNWLLVIAWQQHIFLENDLWHGPVEAVSIISSTCLLPPNLLEVWCHSAGPLYFILLPPGLWCPIDCPRSTSATAVLSLGFCTLALGRDGGNVGYLGVGPVPWGLPHGFPSCCPHDFVTATKKTTHPGHDGFFLAETAASIPDAQEHLRKNCLTWNNMDSFLFLLMNMGSIMFNEVCPIASSSWNLSVSKFI